MDDNAGCMTILGAVLLVCLLASIPKWVYVTLGCILLAGLAIWGLAEAGVNDWIEDWWKAKSVKERIYFRKRIWWTLISAGILALCYAYPLVAIPTVIIAITIGLWCRRKRLSEPCSTHPLGRNDAR